METIAWLGAAFFILGYGLITLEQKFSTHKSAIALVMGGVLWLLAALHLRGEHGKEELSHALSHTGAEIFSIVAFLLAAMALIEILVHYRLFDLIRDKLVRLKVGLSQQFLVILTITFFFSAVLDNIAITIAMLQIARRFFSGKNLVLAAAGIVVAANAGGAWSPIGDVTTILLWLADKFTATEVIKYAFLPSFTLFAVATALLFRKLERGELEAPKKTESVKLTHGEKLVVGTALGSFSLPLLVSFAGLPPYMGLLLGLGLTWSMVELAKRMSKKANPTHMSANIERLLQTVDIASVKYIMGILLAVGALSALGVLLWLSQTAIGTNPSEGSLVGITMGLGLVSGIVDNASLIAIAIKTLPMEDPQLWSLAAVAAGNGGSLMVIASAAGVVAMGNFKQLTVVNYFKLATVPVLIGITASYLVWALQYYILFK